MIIGFDDYKEKYNFQDVSGVIHVGAHHGQELDAYLSTFGSVFIHWFEPLPDVFDADPFVEHLEFIRLNSNCLKELPP